jgi:hypothetical protein
MGARGLIWNSGTHEQEFQFRRRICDGHVGLLAEYLCIRIEKGRSSYEVVNISLGHLHGLVFNAFS